jgi:hypothetical protein
MTRLPILLSILILGGMIFAVRFILTYPGLALTDSELIQSIIGVVATGGALISAAFVIPAYIQNLRTFYEAHRPQLLVQVENRHKTVPEHPSPIPETIIHYRNISSNQFNDLTLRIYVKTIDEEINISDLFSPNMTMPGQDQRQKHFEPVPYLNERGFYLNTEIAGSPPSELHIEYQYHYAGRFQRIRAQIYVWNVKEQIWEIK